MKILNQQKKVSNDYTGCVSTIGRQGDKDGGH